MPDISSKNRVMKLLSDPYDVNGQAAIDVVFEDGSKRTLSVFNNDSAEQKNHSCSVKELEDGLLKIAEDLASKKNFNEKWLDDAENEYEKRVANGEQLGTFKEFREQKKIEERGAIKQKYLSSYKKHGIVSANLVFESSIQILPDLAGQFKKQNVTPVHYRNSIPAIISFSDKDGKAPFGLELDGTQKMKLSAKLHSFADEKHVLRIGEIACRMLEDGFVKKDQFVLQKLPEINGSNLDLDKYNELKKSDIGSINKEDAIRTITDAFLAASKNENREVTIFMEGGYTDVLATATSTGISTELAGIYASVKIMDDYIAEDGNLVTTRKFWVKDKTTGLNIQPLSTKKDGKFVTFIDLQNKAGSLDEAVREFDKGLRNNCLKS